MLPAEASGDQLGALGGNDSDLYQSSSYSSDGTNASNYASDVSGQGVGNNADCDATIQYCSDGGQESDYESGGKEYESNATNQYDVKHDGSTLAVDVDDLSGISDFSDDDSSLCHPSERMDIVTTDGTELFGFGSMNRIYTHSVEDDEWCERKLDIFGDVMTRRELEDSVFTYDEKSGNMWIQSVSKGLLKIHLNSAEVTHLDVELPQLMYPAMQMVGDILHIVKCEYGPDSPEQMTHITVDTITHELTKNDYTSSNLDGYQGNFFCVKLIFSKSTNQLYLFGSGNVSDPRECDGNVLFKYSLDTQKWTSAKTANLNSFGTDFYDASIVLSNDERHVFVIRGRSAPTDEGDVYSNKLAVYDMANNIMRCCSLKLPPREEDGVFDAAILRYRSKESLLSVGYVRQLLRTPDLNGLVLPGDLMHFISQWIAIEFIHVVQTYSYSGQHFRVNVEDIMEALQ